MWSMIGYILIGLLRELYLYTHTKVKQHHIFSESCRMEYVGNGNQIFWILLQILLLLWALIAKNDLVNQVFG